jgi:hypothetical protein
LFRAVSGAARIGWVGLPFPRGDGAGLRHAHVRERAVLALVVAGERDAEEGGRWAGWERGSGEWVGVWMVGKVKRRWQGGVLCTAKVQ